MIAFALATVQAQRTDELAAYNGSPFTSARAIEKYGEDYGSVSRFHTALTSTNRAGRLKLLYTDYQTLLSRLNFASLTDKARISRELVRLKNDVPLTDGLDDLVLQQPDGQKLIAFLKTMEFTTLTRRVAEATGTDAAEVAPAVVTVDATDVHGPDVGAGAPRPETPAAETAAPASAPVTNGKINTPAALAGARAQAVTGAKIDHKRYASIRHRAELETWVAEARETGSLPSVPKPPRSIRCAASRSALRSPSSPGRPLISRSATAPVPRISWAAAAQTIRCQWTRRWQR